MPYDRSRFEDHLRALSAVPFKERKREEKLAAYELRGMVRNLAALVPEEKEMKRLFVELLKHLLDIEQVRALLVTFFSEPDIKLRRRAIAIAGDSEDSALAAPLVAALEKESHRVVQASIVLALGALGFDFEGARWKEVEPALDSDVVRDAIKKARAHSKVRSLGSSSRDISLREPPVGTYLLECYPGMEEAVALEARTRSLELTVWRDGWLEGEHDQRRNLFQLRSVRAWYKLATSSGRIVEADLVGLVDDVRSGTDEGAPTYRYQIPREETRNATDRALRERTRWLDARGFVNSPSGYRIQLREVDLEGRTYFLWADAAWPSPRRSVKLEAIAASIHPSVAAGLCAVAGSAEDELFCDPFCGGGTLLFERHHAGPYRELHGADISDRALASARRNLARIASARLQLKECDSMVELPSGVTCAVSNLPFGIRSGERRDLREMYGRFLDVARRSFAPRCRYVFYTAAPNELAHAGERSGISLKEWGTVNAGGLRVSILTSGDRYLP